MGLCTVIVVDAVVGSRAGELKMEWETDSANVWSSVRVFLSRGFWMRYDVIM